MEKFESSILTLVTPPLREFCKGSCPYRPWEHAHHTFKHILEQLAFNAPKIRGSRDPGHALFENFVRGHVWTVIGNMLVKFEVHSFEGIGLCQGEPFLQTGTQTDTKVKTLYPPVKLKLKPNKALDKNSSLSYRA